MCSSLRGHNSLCCSCAISACWLGKVSTRKEKKRKNSAGSDDTASRIKGGGYLLRCPHQATPHRADNIKGIYVGQGGCVP